VSLLSSASVRSKGADPRVVAERLGHADPGLTLRVYAHATATMQGEATAAMDRVLGA